jgi:uncharacterized protein YlxP (DUF503 family)
MVVGSLRLVFLIPHAGSLKDKRAVVRKIIDRARAKFNASVAEVGDLDVHRRAVIGVSVVSNDATHATSMLTNIASTMASSAAAQCVSQRVSIQPVNEHDLTHELESPLGLDVDALLREENDDGW